MTGKAAALFMGIIFIAVGLLGFIDNPIVYKSQTAIFHADPVHNGVHIVSDVLFLLIALAAEGPVKRLECGGPVRLLCVSRPWSGKRFVYRTPHSLVWLLCLIFCRIIKKILHQV